MTGGGRTRDTGRHIVGADEFTVIDTAHKVVTSKFRIGNEYPEVSRGFAVITGRLYVPIPIGGEFDWTGGKVDVIDPSTDTGPYPVEFDGGGDSAIDPARQSLYITNFRGGTASEINLETMELVRTHRVGDAPRSPVVDPGTHNVYTSDGHSRSISVIEPETSCR